MAGKKEKKSDFQLLVDFFKKPVTALVTAVRNEFTSPPGLANLLLDILLSLVVVFMVTATGASTIARMIISIWNRDLTPNTGDESLFVMLLILIGFWVLCLLFQLVCELVWSKKDK